MKNSTLLIVAFLLAFNGSSSAAPLVYEGFAYADGSLTGQNGGIGWETAWGTTTPAVPTTGRGTVGAGSIGYGTLTTSGGSIAMSTIFPGNNYRDLNGPLGGDGSDLWMSVVLNLGSSGGTRFSVYNSDSLMLTLGAYASTGYLVDYSGGTGSPLAVGMNQDLGVGRGSGSHFLVMRLNMNTGGVPVYTTWIDPDLTSLGVGGAPTGGTPVVVNSGTQNFTFDRVEVARGAASGGSFSSTSFFDELRIGTSWVDVSPIPEPATGLMLVAGLGMLTCVRRRR